MGWKLSFKKNETKSIIDTRTTNVHETAGVEMFSDFIDRLDRKVFHGITLEDRRAMCDASIQIRIFLLYTYDVCYTLYIST